MLTIRQPVSYSLKKYWAKKYPVTPAMKKEKMKVTPNEMLSVSYLTPLPPPY
jgi:hypothetical protein